MSATPDIGKVLDSIVNEVGFMESEWVLFSSIYFERKRAEAFHHVLPVSYNIIAHALERDMALMIARLFDPATSPVKGGARDNVSIPALLDAAGIDIDGLDPQDRLATAFRTCKTRCDPFRDPRNKLIAHLDANVHIGGEQFDVPTRETAGEAIEALKALLDAIAIHLERPPVMWQVFGTEGVRREVTALFEQSNEWSTSRQIGERGLAYE